MPLEEIPFSLLSYHQNARNKQPPQGLLNQIIYAGLGSHQIVEIYPPPPAPQQESPSATVQQQPERKETGLLSLDSKAQVEPEKVLLLLEQNDVKGQKGLDKKLTALAQEKDAFPKLVERVLAAKSKELKPKHITLLGKIADQLSLEKLEDTTLRLEQLRTKDAQIKTEIKLTAGQLRQQAYRNRAPTIRRNLPVVVELLKMIIINERPEGLFRVPGNETNITQLKQLTSSVTTTSGDIQNLGGTNDIASTYKAWIEIVTPLDYQHLQELEELALEPKEAFATAFDWLAEKDKQVLRDLFMLTDLLAERQDNTKMGPANTATCFAERLFKDVPKDDFQSGVRRTKFCNGFFQEGYKLYKSGQLGK